MVFSNIILVLVVVSVSCTAADGALSWGTFLGADWKLGEGETAETTMGAAQISAWYHGQHVFTTAPHIHPHSIICSFASNIFNMMVVDIQKI